MANLISTLLETAIYNEAHGDSTLWNSVSGRFKHGTPDPAWEKPYVLYSFGNLPDRNVMAKTTPSATIIDIYFDIFDSSDFATNINTIGGYIDDVFTGASLSVTGYQSMTLVRSGNRTIQEEETALWHLQLHYTAVACVT